MKKKHTKKSRKGLILTVSGIALNVLQLAKSYLGPKAFKEFKQDVFLLLAKTVRMKKGR